MTAHKHLWEGVFDERNETGRLLVPQPTPLLWHCALCDANHRGETAPDGTTFDQASDAYHHALDAASRL